MNISRRNFLKSGSLAFSALGLNLVTPMMFQRQALAANPNNNKRMIFIFQRGGNDGLNTIIPRGDADYSPTTRPTLYLPENLCIDSGNGFAQFHPALQPMMEIYNHAAINGVDGPGNLAMLHRIGYPSQSRSHFDSEQYWENGVPGESGLEEGMIYRHLANTVDMTSEENAFIAASISSSSLVSLKGAHSIPNFSRASSFRFGNNDAQSDKLLGVLPNAGQNGRGLMGLYGAQPGAADKNYRSLVHGSGRLLGATFQTIQDALAQGEYVPENGAVYPDSSLGRKLQECAMLLKRTPARILGVNKGGWDTHGDQGQASGYHGNLLGDVAQGFQALYRDLQGMWDDVIIVTMTEFGRTSEENDSGGTDHAEAAVMFAAGGAVNGGVYNCEPSRWEEGAMFSANGRYLRRRTDYRAVFAEIFTNHFGDDPALLDEIIPYYRFAERDDPDFFAPLGFVS